MGGMEHGRGLWQSDILSTYSETPNSLRRCTNTNGISDFPAPLFWGPESYLNVGGRGLLRIIRQHPATISATVCLLVLTSIFWLTGGLWPTELPDYATSRRQVIGMSLMLILMPSYFVVAGFFSQRRSLDLVDQLEPLLPDERHARDARSAIRGAPLRSALPGSALGIGMGLLNARLHDAFFESATPAIDITTALGQVFMWWIIGMVISQRLIVARRFDRIGEVIHFDLFQLDRLRVFARSGLNDVLIIAGALSLSPLQALDAEFRWINYSFALWVSIPAAFTLLVLPLRHLHRRIVHEKNAQLSRVEERIDAVIAGGVRDDVPRFEALLSHRDRLHGVSTWPLGTALVSRVFVYLIIPPIAWAGAALVERLLEGWLG